MLIIILVSTILGTLSSLGIGGGSLLMLWLTFVCQYDFLSAKFINLSFFLPAAFLSCCFQFRTLRHTVRYVIPAAISGCCCAYAFSRFSQGWNLLPIKKGFGILLIITAIHEIRISFKKDTT